MKSFLACLTVEQLENVTARSRRSMYFILFEDEVGCFAVDESPYSKPISKEFHISDSLRSRVLVES